MCLKYFVSIVKLFVYKINPARNSNNSLYIFFFSDNKTFSFFTDNKTCANSIISKYTPLFSTLLPASLLYA